MLQKQRQQHPQQQRQQQQQPWMQHLPTKTERQGAALASAPPLLPRLLRLPVRPDAGSARQPLMPMLQQLR